MVVASAVLGRLTSTLVLAGTRKMAATMARRSRFALIGLISL
jgi:hypothetical protein